MEGSSQDAFDYIQLVDKLKPAEFCRRHPHAVLIFFSVNKKLRPVEQGAPGAAGTTALAAPPKSESGELLTGTYLVFPIKRRDGRSGECSIGCAKGCDVQIEDASIAERHAAIELRGHSYWLTDHGADAGTEVNGAPLTQDEPRQLVSGTGVRLGEVDLVFLEAPEFYQFIKRFYEL